MAEFQWPADVTEHQMEAVSAIVWVLHEHGPVVDESGRATKILEDLLTERGVQVDQLSKFLAQMDTATAQARYGHLIRRKRSATRTSRIELARLKAYPPNPLAPGGGETEGEEPQLLDDVDTEDAEQVYIDDIDDMLTESDPDEYIPGTDLVPVEDGSISVLDRLLYAQSSIGEAIAQITEEEMDRRHQNMAEQFELVERLVRDNEALKSELQDHKRQLRQLQRALQQAGRR